MNTFAILADDDDDNGSEAEEEELDPLSHFQPQYSFKDIMAQYKPNSQPPSDLIKYDSIYIRESQNPESNQFVPPNSDINSDPNASTKPPIRPFQLQSRKPKQTTKPTKKPPIIQTKTSETEEDAGQNWYYQDPMGQTIGPFSSKKMHEWFERKYFDSTLLVHDSRPDSKFQQFYQIFHKLFKLIIQRYVQSMKEGRMIRS